MDENVKRTRVGVIPTLRHREGGAAIVMEPEDQGHGGRLHACRDPEGHLWNFGSYDPWADESGA